MIQVGILEQILTFFKILFKNPYIIALAIISLASLFILIFASKFKNKKVTKVLYLIVYLGIFGTLLYFYHSEIFKLFDYLINNIFLFLFFPNLAVYILVLVIINTIIIKSTCSSKDSLKVKILNIIFFIIFNIIFYLIIYNIIKNKVDVYEQLSVYTNSDLLNLIELSMKLFVFWILVLIIIKLSSVLLNRMEIRKLGNKNLNLVETFNKEELINVNSISKVKKVIPEILDTKIESLETVEDFSKEIQNDIQTENAKASLKNTLVIEQLEDFETPSEIAIKKEEVKEESPKITLSSYDSIFKENNQKLEVDIAKNMQVVFDNKSNNLNNIILDIQELKNNKDDKNKIEKIYENIKDNRNELTLNDYNTLINALLELKK